MLEETDIVLTDVLTDVNAIPTKEKQQKEVKNLLNLLSMLLMRIIFLSAKKTVMVQGNS